MNWKLEMKLGVAFQQKMNALAVPQFLEIRWLQIGFRSRAFIFLHSNRKDQ